MAVPSTINIAEASIGQLLQVLASGATTSVELTSLFLHRIGRYDFRGPLLNSICVLNPHVLVEAQASDDYRASGKPPRPLEVFTVKDRSVATSDAAVVASLRAAGAILLGRTNMPAMADGGSQRGHFGRAESPYNQEYMCTSYGSGSSSGSGVAKAAGFAPIGLGSETVSSGRAPASVNGIIGYSPSRGPSPDVTSAKTRQPCAAAFADSVKALWLRAKADLEALGASVTETDFPLVENYSKQCFPGQAANVPGMPEGWIDTERCEMIALGWDDFLRANDAPNCKTLASVDHEKIRPFYAPLDDPRKHTEVQNHVRYPDMIDFIRRRPSRDLEAWLDEHDFDALIFPTNGDVARADAEEVLSSMENALRDGVKYSNGTRAMKHMGVPAVTVPMGVMADKQMPVGPTFAGRAHGDSDLLSTRHVDCHGYGQRPTWMDGGAKQKEETQRIKAAVKRNFKQLRRQQVRAAQARSREPAEEKPCTPDEPSTQPKAYEESAASQEEADAITSQLLSLDAPLSVDFPFSDDLATFLGPVPESGLTTRRHSAPSYEESELLMYYLDHIFPMQYTHYSNRKWGRGWLFWLLNKNGPLYKAALSLAALHKHSLMSAMGEDLKHNDVLLEYHTSALRGLQDFIGKPEGQVVSSDDEDFIEVIACGSALISFEVFRGGTGDWQPHLQATTAITKTMDPCRLVFHASGRLGTSASSSSRERRGVDAALSFHAPVLLWMDLLACASTGDAPFLPYESWLQMEGFDMTRIMGCQNWVMKAIGDLAVLEEWKNGLDGETENAFDWIDRATKIGNELEAGMEGLDLHGEASNSDSPVTRIFATAALVQLYAMRASLALAEPAEGQRAVARVIGEIRRAPRQRLSIRQLTWPICIAGSMAAPHQESFFEDLVMEVLAEPDASFGNCKTVKEIMRRCWDRRKLQPGRHWDWRRTMSDMGICALLI
ncbi:hypothetical protein ACHAQH_003710 [Verticillium albo-atrum]